jgi:hypothetical protein
VVIRALPPQAVVVTKVPQVVKVVKVIKVQPVVKVIKVLPALWVIPQQAHKVLKVQLVFKEILVPKD